jgi:hypothetical protein
MNFPLGTKIMLTKMAKITLHPIFGGNRYESVHIMKACADTLSALSK